MTKPEPTKEPLRVPHWHVHDVPVLNIGESLFRLALRTSGKA